MSFSEELEKYLRNFDEKNENVDRDATFKGIWMPKEVLDSENASLSEKVLLSAIFTLSKSKFGCIASNEYLASICKISKREITYHLKTLVDKKILKKSKEECTRRRKIEIDFSGL